MTVEEIDRDFAILEVDVHDNDPEDEERLQQALDVGEGVGEKE